MQRDEYVERDVKCNHCSSTLTELERIEYGDYCVFCGERKMIMNRWKIGVNMILGYRIHRLKGMLKKKYGKDAGYMFLGALAVVGLTGISGFESLDLQREAIKELKGLLRRRPINLEIGSPPNN